MVVPEVQGKTEEAPQAPGAQVIGSAELPKPEGHALDEAIANSGTLEADIKARDARRAGAPKARINPVQGQSAEKVRKDMRDSTVHGSKSLEAAVQARDANRPAIPVVPSADEMLGRKPDKDGIVDFSAPIDPLATADTMVEAVPGKGAAATLAKRRAAGGKKGQSK